MNANKPIIICGFPGVGKTSAARGRSDILDLDSSAYSSDKSFPINYVDKIQTVYEETGLDYILVSCHYAVRIELTKRGIPFIIVIPQVACMNEYLIRYLKRGDSFDEIKKIYKYWDTWLFDIRTSYAADDRRSPIIMLDSGKTLSDILPKPLPKPLRRLNRKVIDENGWVYD